MTEKKTSRDKSANVKKEEVITKKNAAFESAMQGTEAAVIWGEIKNSAIEMFAIPNQIVEMHCTPVPADPNRLFLVMTSTAVLPSLESAINKNAKGSFEHRFNVELADRFVIVSRVPNSFSEKYGIKI
jgi:hypothetical protein